MLTKFSTSFSIIEMQLMMCAGAMVLCLSRQHIATARALHHRSFATSNNRVCVCLRGVAFQSPAPVACPFQFGQPS